MDEARDDTRRDDGPVLARCLHVREERRLGFAIALVMGIATAAILMRKLSPHNWFEFSRFWSVGIAAMVWCAGLALTWWPRPVVKKLHDVRRDLGLGEPFLVSGSPEGLRVGVARAERGLSIAITTGDRSSRAWLLEVDGEADARRLLRRLHVPWPGTDGVTFHLPRARVRQVRSAMAIVGATSALLYGIVVGGFDDRDFRALFGLPSLVLGLAASGLFLVEPLLRRAVLLGRDALPGDSALARHVELHRTRGIAPAEAASSSRSNDTRRAELDRTTETTRAWLERLDAMAMRGEGYRATGFSAEELRLVAADERASTHERLGALRLLAKHPNGLPDDLRARVSHDLGEPRIRVVLSTSPEDAAEELDALGPSFRARA